MIYLSGPMSGIDDYNRPAFNALAGTLRNMGKEIFNPAEVGNPDHIMSREWYMKEDIKALLECTSIVMLPGWENSKGALLELAIAEELNLPTVKLTGSQKSIGELSQILDLD